MKHFIVFLCILSITSCQRQFLEQALRQRYKSKTFVQQSSIIQHQQQTRLLQQDQDDQVDHQEVQQHGQIQKDEVQERKKIRKIVKKRRIILKPIVVNPTDQLKNKKKRKVHKTIKKCKRIIQD